MLPLPSIHLAAAAGDLGYLLDVENADFNKRDSDGNTPLHYASLMGKLKVLSFLIEKKHLDVNIKGQNGETPLHWAATTGNMDIVRHLIRQGANFNQRNDYNNTPLHEAALARQMEVVKYLINVKEVDINTKGNRGDTVLHWAANNGKLNTVIYLILGGANVYANNDYHNTPFHSAAMGGKLDVLQYMLDHRDIDVNTKGERDYTALHMAVDTGNIDVIKHLVDKGANINLANDKNNVPLHIAAFYGYTDILKYLIENANADVNVKGYNGNTPLHLAARNNKLQSVKYLLEKGADLNTIDNYKNTPLNIAENNGHLDVVKYLSKKITNTQYIPPTIGFTTLHWAAHKGDLELVKFLIENGAHYTKSDNDKNTPIHIAAIKGHLNVMKYFIENVKVNINIKGQKDYTPLLLATKYDHLDIIKYLIEEGANINMGNIDGETPLHLATREGNLEVVKYFIEKEADVNSRNVDGNTPIHNAVEGGHLNVLKYLIGVKNVDINIKGHHGETPLHWAARYGWLELVKYLVEKGGDLHQFSDNKDLPIHFAAINGKLEVLKYLIEIKNVDTNIKNQSGYTPLHLSVKHNHIESVKYLVENKADINIKNNDKETPLHISVLNDSNLNITKYLILKKVDINVRDGLGHTPLHLAAIHNSLDTLKYLLEEGANWNIVDNDKNTPVHLAAARGQLSVLKYLIETMHADINIRGQWGYTPLHWAAREGMLDTVMYLIKKDANVNILENNKNSPLHLAAWQGHLDVVKYLIDEAHANLTNILDYSKKNTIQNKAEIIALLTSKSTIKNKFINEAAVEERFSELECLGEDRHVYDNKRGQWGYTLLHWAARDGKLNLVKCLIRSGADVNKLENIGNSPLNLAAWQGHLDIVKYLVDEANAKLNNVLVYSKKNSLKNKKEIVSFLESRGARTKRSTGFDLSPLSSGASKSSSIFINPIMNLSYLIYAPYKMITSLYNTYNGRSNFQYKQTKKNFDFQYTSKFSLETCASNNFSLLYLIQELLDRKYPLPIFSIPESPEETVANALNIVEDFEATLKQYNLDVDNIDFFKVFNDLQIHLKNGSFSKIKDVLISTLDNDIDNCLPSAIMEEFKRYYKEKMAKKH